ncbi:hypothetical protein RIN61_26660, partial [Pseudomonas inefficax]|uniref:hypothetical protein n=1 Tax=Pseudomonas inefficax TaxID=2078786 RepID=UPI0028BD6793
PVTDDGQAEGRVAKAGAYRQVVAIADTVTIGKTRQHSTVTRRYYGKLSGSQGTQHYVSDASHR